MGEEDRSGALPAAQTVLLAEVWKGAADHRVAPGLAHGDVVVEAVHPTVAWAGPTVFEGRERTLDASRQSAARQRAVDGPDGLLLGHGHVPQPNNDMLPLRFDAPECYRSCAWES